MKHMKVQLKDIMTEGPDAGRFSFSFESDVAKLADSIKEVGLVNPPILRSGNDQLDVVCGFKRVLACKSLGVFEIDTMIYKTDELPDEKCLWFSLIDNARPGVMSAVESAIALKKFADHGYGSDRLAREIAPHLGVPASRRYVEDCIQLLSLDKEIVHAIHNGSFGVEQAFCLLHIDEESQLPMFRVLSSCRANLNETRELVSLVPDVAAMKNLTVSEFIEEEIAPIMKDESPPRRKLQRLRDHLTRARYPRLTAAESAFERVMREMNLDERCRISAPKHFEGGEITVTIRAESADKLGEIIAGLSSAQDGFRKLFSILQGGEDS